MPLCKGEIQRQTHTLGECHVKTQGEDDHLQAKERGLEQIFPSQPLEGTNLANTLISDLEPPEL